MRLHTAFTTLVLLNRSTAFTTASSKLCRAMSTAKAAARSALDEMHTNGEFKRKPSVYRSKVTEPEAGRYHLYVSYACPWAHRTLMVRALKDLTDSIGVTVVHPTWQKTSSDPNDTHYGWAFGNADHSGVTPATGVGSIVVDGADPDPLEGFNTIRDVYEAVNDTNGKYTVPILWDKKTRTIVNNESSDIIEMLDRDFSAIASADAPDLNPKETHAAQEAANEWIYAGINNGVYRSGFAQSQAAYDAAVTEVFDALDKAEGILSKQRYITGNTLTLADIRLFVTLVRFDEVYVVYFKTNKARIADYPNLLNYVRDIYQLPGIADTVNMQHIKAHYYTSHPKLNAYSIIPAGPNAIADFSKPHDRDRFTK